jgi:hypothetical protein
MCTCKSSSPQGETEIYLYKLIYSVRVYGCAYIEKASKGYKKSIIFYRLAVRLDDDVDDQQGSMFFSSF